MRTLGGVLPPGFENFASFHNLNTGPEPDTWNARGHWDPGSRRTFFFGDRNAQVFHSYIASSNQWIHNPLWEGMPANHHQYGAVAFDRQRQHYYRKSGGKLFRFLISENRWEAAADFVPVSEYSPMEYHPGLDAIVAVGDFELHAFRAGSWSSLGNSAHHGHHSNVIFNRVRAELLIIGGNRSRNAVTLMDMQGSLTEMKPLPFNWRAQHHVLTYDPTTGNYLVLHRRERTLWEYSPVHDEWRLARDWGHEPGWPFGQYFGHVLIPIDEYGTLLWIHRTGPVVYRHQSAFLTSRGNETRPNAPTIHSPAVDPSNTLPTPSTSNGNTHANAQPERASTAATLSSTLIRRLRTPGLDAAAPHSAHTVPADTLASATIRAIRAGRITIEDLALQEDERSPPQANTPATRPTAETQDLATSRDHPYALPAEPKQYAPHERFSRIGATMKPGEWRYVQTENVPSFRVKSCKDENRSTHALGWTDAFAYDPQTQSFWAIGMREASEKRLFMLDRNLVWREISMPWGEDCTRDRRPFNRLTVVDLGDGPHLYWPLSKGSPSEVGRLIRAPIDAYLRGEQSVVWESFSEGFGIRNMDRTGDFAVEWFPEVGAWIFFGRQSSTANDTPFSQEGHTHEGLEARKRWYGRAMYLLPSERVWRHFDRAYSGQYRARLLYNPLREELMLAPGGEFGSQPEGNAPHREWAAVRLGGNAQRIGLPGGHPAPIVRKLDRAEAANFDPPGYSLRYHSLAYNPKNGHYLWWNRQNEVIWESPDGKRWSVYEDFKDLGNGLFPPGVEHFRGQNGLFGATGYVQVNALPGTDLVVFFDPDKGVILHRTKSNR